jgi:quercetin dioxygenase-like cupin family protein
MTTTNKPTIILNSQGRKYNYSPSESITYLASTTVTGNQSDFTIIVVRPLGGPPLHVHPEQEEVHFLLRGQLQYQVDNETHELQQGDCIIIPPGVAHAWTNLQHQPARILATLTPGGGEPFFNAIAEFQSALEAQTIVSLAHDHGTNIVGPPLRT